MMITRLLSPNEAQLLLLILEHGGSMTKSRRAIVKELGLSERNFRTAKDNLLAHGLIAVDRATDPVNRPSRPTQFDTPLTLYLTDDCKAFYHLDRPSVATQCCDPRKEKEGEKESFPLTIPYKEKDKEKENSIVAVDARTRERFRQELRDSSFKKEQMCMVLGIELPEFERMASTILAEWEVTNASDWDWSHLMNHMRVKLRVQQADGRTRQERRADWRAQLAAQAQAAMKNLQ